MGETVIKKKIVTDTDIVEQKYNTNIFILIYFPTTKYFLLKLLGLSSNSKPKGII